MLKKNLQAATLSGSIILSFAAYIIPLTSRVAPDGSYIGIDCDAFTMEPLIWFLALASLIGGFLISRSLRRPLIIVAALMLLFSFIFKYSEYREFDSQTGSALSCQNS